MKLNLLQAIGAYVVTDWFIEVSRGLIKELHKNSKELSNKNKRFEDFGESYGDLIELVDGLWESGKINDTECEEIKKAIVMEAYAKMKTVK